MATISYCNEKFSKAVDVLATHPGNLRTRLLAASIEASVAPVGPLAGEARTLYGSLQERWTSHSDGNPGGGNGIGHYIDGLNEDELPAQAKLLVYLEYLTRP